MSPLSGRKSTYRPVQILEASSHFTDSLNKPAFPTTVLRPGERFASRTVYRFGAA
jgi:aldose 1-epimerase